VTIDPTVVIAAIAALSAALGTAARMIYMDLRRDRDEWKALAVASEKDIGRLTTVVEAALSIKVPPAP